MHIPDALIRAISYTRSKRLPTLTPAVFPKAAIKNPIYSPFPVPSAIKRLPMPGVPAGMRSIPNFTSKAGNLANVEYRHYVGAELTHSLWCKCRCCDLYVPTPAARRDHLVAGDCKFLMGAVIRLLREWGKCTVCDHVTQRKIWGIPLCSEACEVRWRFNNPPSFIAALKVVEADPAQYKNIPVTTNFEDLRDS